MSTTPLTTPLPFEESFSRPPPDPGELLDGQSVDPLQDEDPATDKDPAEAAVDDEISVLADASFPASLLTGDSTPDPAPDKKLDPNADVEPSPEPEPGDAGMLLFPRLSLSLIHISEPTRPY